MSEARYFVLSLDNCLHEGMTKEEILSAIQQGLEQGYVSDPDAAVISKIKEMRASGTVQLWVGTEAQHNALTETDANTLYVVTAADGKFSLFFGSAAFNVGDFATKEEVEAKCDAPITANNVKVAASAWAESTDSTNYPYRAAVALSGVTVGMTADVYFSLADSESGLYSQGGTIYNGGLYLYANSLPEADITIDRIIVWR